MRIAYVVVSHRDEQQVRRLVRALRAGDPAGVVVLHHDPVLHRLDESGWASGDGVHLLTADAPVPWGSFRLVEVICRCMQVAVELLSADWVVVLSGDDYPVRPLSQLRSLIAASECDAFLEFSDDPSTERRAADAGAGMYRYRYVPLPRVLRLVGDRLSPARSDRILEVAKGLGRRQGLLSVKGQPRGLPPLLGWRRFRQDYRPDGLPFRKGRAFFAVSAAAAQAVLDFVAQRPAYTAHYRRTCIPGESFFHTLLDGLPGIDACRFDLHYESWGPDDPSPRVLRTADLEAMRASGCYFARKFDRQVDEEVLDRLDALLSSP